MSGHHRAPTRNGCPRVLKELTDVLLEFLSLILEDRKGVVAKLDGMMMR